MNPDEIARQEQAPPQSETDKNKTVSKPKSEEQEKEVQPESKTPTDPESGTRQIGDVGRMPG